MTTMEEEIVVKQWRLSEDKSKVIPNGWKDGAKEGPLQTTIHQVYIVKKGAWNWRKRRMVVLGF